MSIETIVYKNKIYPKFQTTGFAAKFAFPFAKEILKGTGIDVGCNRTEWAFGNDVGAVYTDIEQYLKCDKGIRVLAVDPIINGYDSLNIPVNNLDFIFSSHALEHMNDWVKILDYWRTLIIVGGVIFLYLPDYSQEYWKPWNNIKHKHIFTPEILNDYFKDRGYKNIFCSGIDLNNSFIVIAEK